MSLSGLIINCSQGVAIVELFIWVSRNGRDHKNSGFFHGIRCPFRTSPSKQVDLQNAREAFVSSHITSVPVAWTHTRRSLLRSLSVSNWPEPCSNRMRTSYFHHPISLWMSSLARSALKPFMNPTYFPPYLVAERSTDRLDAKNSLLSLLMVWPFGFIGRLLFL